MSLGAKQERFSQALTILMQYARYHGYEIRMGDVFRDPRVHGEIGEKKAYGHKNIKALHKNTFEFTKDDFVTETGDCIIGIRSDFKIPPGFADGSNAVIEMEADGVKESVKAELSKDFSSDHEMVFRRSDFLSDRTLGIHADKACIEFSEEFREKLKDPDMEIDVTITKEADP